MDNSDYNRVVGNCGVSWISVRQTGTNHVQVGSGFTVNAAPAVQYNWTITLSDANGTSDHGSSGNLASKYSWARSWNNLFQKSWTFDHVSNGLAVLSDGSICHAGRPSVSISGLG